MQIKFNRRISYTVFTIVFFIFWFLFKVGGMPDVTRALLSTLVDISISITALIITVEILLPAFFYRKKYLAFFGLFVLLIFIAGSIIILTQLKMEGSSLSEYHQNVMKSKVHFFYWFWADLVLGSYFLVFFLSATGASIRFAFDRLNAINVIEKLEKATTAAELKSLKDQVNPHFLFNALNTIYYKIDRSNTDARNILQKFSEMLIYQLYECDKDFISIRNELGFLESYIELQKARLNNNYEVVYTGFETIKEFSIAPFLLMPIIENCFKHVSEFDDKLNRIKIEVRTEDNYFLLYTSNTIQKKEISQHRGIGIENVKRRLKVLYDNKYLLNMKSSEIFFEANLKLNLQ